MGTSVLMDERVLFFFGRVEEICLPVLLPRFLLDVCLGEEYDMYCWSWRE